ncbi:hypothetical protein [Thalassomonas haliotis]|uniref:DUF420 domain-containing protein n=1 Tax=Thalassomonas haliotis TaxID=485448 RepID=A0ABY7VKN8_9GAMM|nr:hypothetical protein [Thalassomonas haliotis]WDE13570.1 hypothetical protein H3N35_09115 [Thalassomonas haliotis]
MDKAMNVKLYLTALLTWFIGMPAIIAVSFTLRTVFGFTGLGMPENVWFFSHILLAICALVALYFSVKSINKTKQALHFLSITLVGACYYLIVTGLYVIQSGIDSL